MIDIDLSKVPKIIENKQKNNIPFMEAAIQETLMPCPFCGSHNVLLNNDSYDIYAFCDSCGAMGSRQATQWKAIEVWNRRAQEQKNNAISRIKQLTEKEAKAALRYLVEMRADDRATQFSNELQYEKEMNMHMNNILDEALEEAQYDDDD